MREDAKAVVDMQSAINGTNNPVAKWRLRKVMDKCWRRIEKDIEARTRVRFATLQQQEVLPTKATATNLLDRLLLAQIQSGRPLEAALIKLILEKY